MTNQADLDWLADLDWRAHGPARDGYVSRHAFLAEAAEMIGRQVCGIWPTIPYFVRMAGDRPPGDIVVADDAFDAAGRPIATVHRRLEAVMRDHAQVLDVPLAGDDVITHDEWDRIIVAGELDWDDGEGARRAAAGIAQVFARMASEEALAVFARPNGGGATVTLGPDYWEIDDDQAVRRLAACGLSLDRPFDAAAPIDHRIQRRELT